MGIDAKWRRTYVPKSAATSPPGTASLASSQVRRLARFDCVSRPVTGKLQVLHACWFTIERGCLCGKPGTFSAWGKVHWADHKGQRHVDVREECRSPVDSKEKCIQLAALLGSFDLTGSYGVPSGLAKTMGLRLKKLKDAGLFSGKTNDASGWKLPKEYPYQALSSPVVAPSSNED